MADKNCHVKSKTQLYPTSPSWTRPPISGLFIDQKRKRMGHRETSWHLAQTRRFKANRLRSCVWTARQRRSWRLYDCWRDWDGMPIWVGNRRWTYSTTSHQMSARWLNHSSHSLTLNSEVNWWRKVNGAWRLRWSMTYGPASRRVKFTGFSLIGMGEVIEKAEDTKSFLAKVKDSATEVLKDMGILRDEQGDEM